MFNFEKHKDVIAGVFLALVGSILFISTFSIKVVGGMSAGITSDFVPKIASALLVIAGGGLAVQGWFSNKNLPACSDKSEQPQDNKKNKKVLLTMILIGGYIALLQPLGYMIATALYLFAQISMLAPKGLRKYVKFAIIAIITAVSIYFLFRNVFELILPAGIGGKLWGL